MIIHLILLQIAIGQVSEQMKQVCSEANNWTQAIVIISVIVFVNIIIAVVQYFLNLRVKDKDLKINRQTMIAEMSIKIEANLYVCLNEINNFTKGDADEMHKRVLALSSNIRENALYLRNSLQKISQDMVDYYTSVLYDWRKKDYKYEDKMMQKYRKEFNG